MKLKSGGRKTSSPLHTWGIAALSQALLWWSFYRSSRYEVRERWRKETLVFEGKHQAKDTHTQPRQLFLCDVRAAWGWSVNPDPLHAVDSWWLRHCVRQKRAVKGASYHIARGKQMFRVVLVCCVFVVFVCARMCSDEHCFDSVQFLSATAAAAPWCSGSVSHMVIQH